MIAFGCPITDPRAYERYAASGIQLAAEPDSQTLTFLNARSIFRAYNLFCDQAADFDDLEALALLHQDVEIVDSDFCGKVRLALSEPEVAIVGCAGAVGVRSIAWWEGSIRWASFTHRFEEMGGGELPGLTWGQVPSYAETGEVDSIDGLVIVMSPWAVRNLRFDESLGNMHGYDLDICLQARSAGKKVVTTDLRVVHHHSLDLLGDPDGWIAAHMRIAEKWNELLDRDGPDDWRLRARRAEAEAAAARVQLRLAQHHITRLAEDFAELERSGSWRVTAPLRALGRLARRLRHPRRAPGRQLGEGVVRPPEPS
jgi:GT2 family glycosyltransferase